MDASLPFEIGVRSSLVLGAGLLALRAMRQRSAAERHLVMMVALGAILLLPVGYRMLPEWVWKALPARTEAFSLRVTATVGKSSQTVPIATHTGGPADLCRPAEIRVNPWMAIWLLGAALHVCWLMVGTGALRRIRRRARHFDLPDFLNISTAELPDIVVSDESRVAFLTGLFRPAIVLPAGAAAWPTKRLRMVLAHELAHLRRRDHWLVPLCGIVSVLYWWQPLAWIALARLRRERERACDDLVIERFQATDYAELLLSAAREAVNGRFSHSALAMASGSNMGSRVMAILDSSLSRRSAARKMVWGVGIGAVWVAVLASTVRLVAAENEAGKVDLVMKSVAAPKPVIPGTQRKQILIETKLADLSEKTADQLREVLEPVVNAKGSVSPTVFEKCVRSLDAKKGVDLMSAPAMTVWPGQKAEIGVTRDFKYGVDFKKEASGELKPSRFAVRKLGVQIEIESTMDGGKIVLNGRLRVTDFDGFIDGENGVQTPVFDVKEAWLLREVGDGESVGTWAWTREDRQIVTDRSPDGSERQSEQVIAKRMAIFFTAKLIEPSQAETKHLPKSAAVPQSEKEMLYGTPVTGKPGFVTSPYAPGDGSVDVRGFPPNTEVKCPYSGKIFLVP